MISRAKSHKPLPAAEIERRRKAYDDYVALCHFEGIEFTDEMKADAERLINGEMTNDEYRRFIIEKFTGRGK